MLARRLPLCAALVLGVAACGPKAPPPPSRDAVLGLLQQEAKSIKAEGEKIDPSFGVSSVWTIDGVEVSERAGDQDKPWAGRIRFKIETRSRDATGSLTDRSQKNFDYVFDAASGRWRMR